MRTLPPFCQGLLFLILATPAAGQAQPLAIGDVVRVRLSGTSSMTVGTLTSMSSDEWALSAADGSVLLLDPSGVIGLERRTLRGNTGRGALIGAGAGLIVGLVATAGDGCESTSGFGEDLCRGLDDAVETTVLLSMPLLGAGVGALIGALARSEAWTPAYAPTVASYGSSIGLGWRVAFR